MNLVLFFMVNQCFALPEDRLQTMALHADSAELNQQLHSGTYIGDVEMHQGSTHIKAAKAITQGNVQNQLIKATIYGDPKAQAHYWVTPEKDKLPVHAYADIMYYDPQRHLIELVGHARVEQGNNSLSASKIAYDIIHQHVLSSSDAHQRTTIIIHPEKHS
jgi:lipopolysaccharide export system protein LptA